MGSRRRREARWRVWSRPGGSRIFIHFAPRMCVHFKNWRNWRILLFLLFPRVLVVLGGNGNGWASAIPPKKSVLSLSFVSKDLVIWPIFYGHWRSLLAICESGSSSFKSRRSSHQTPWVVGDRGDAELPSLRIGGGKDRDLHWTQVMERLFNK